MRLLFLAVSFVIAAGQPAWSAEAVVTVRCGEQDTCQLTGVTTIESQADGAVIRFDLARLPAVKGVKRALLRMWVDTERGPLAKAFAVDRFSAEDFDGLKVWQVGGPAAPLAVSFPFTCTRSPSRRRTSIARGCWARSTGTRS